MAGYEAAFKYKLIYIMVIHDADHDGYLKIGDATLASSLGPSQLPPNCELLNTAAHEQAIHKDVIDQLWIALHGIGIAFYKNG